MSKPKIIFKNQMLAQVTAEKARNPFLIHSVDIKKSWRKNKNSTNMIKCSPLVYVK